MAFVAPTSRYLIYLYEQVLQYLFYTSLKCSISQQENSYLVDSHFENFE